MDKLVNLASLPKEEAIAQVFNLARDVFRQKDVFDEVWEETRSAFINKHLPKACGQSDEEFGELTEAACDAFDAGFEKAFSDVQPAATLDRVSDMLNDESAAAWQVFNVLAFMVEAVADDTPDGLPIRCTLVNLREQVEKLATNLMGLVHNAKLETGGADHA
ncbi:hypothetical protein WKR88_17905 [Trinickia caryophylli]|uniref:Uncharacterized protein n=1 Tax=Trinickia caryophylli TaxID=28094 RepID=A0A1X7DZ19_TRICW|nr:hypothetical protein [Trinickia caryophylli]PMS14137.1 hypothetical protein C0Z17_00935 [Trinickia caryophylli]TRX17835.1 hypothetical protein FNF07_06075 [Trinickia caryophylli]WQE11397.1 hypothetical protein U0034_16845 [Trinickia caryophylli]SMF24080.1 hypothetical protein SAMN06295900_104252 [Trinickia caryophylli]GLU32557.1 hypothetical protein Busp01_23990 [Trinickia caryophylli]